MPRGSIAHNAREHERALCTIFTSSLGQHVHILFTQIPNEAFISAAKAMKRQITPLVLAKYQRWKIDNGVQEL